MMAKKTGYYNSLRQELSGLIEQLQLPGLYKRSLQRRWLDQVIWADQKADQCRRWHYRLRLTTIIGSVILPALVGINYQLGKNNANFRTWFPYVPFVLSQVIAVSAAIEEFCRFGDRWRDYRKMAEDLKAEGWQYLQLSGAYQISDDDAIEPLPTVAASNLQTQLSDSLHSDKTNGSATTHLKRYATFASRVESIIKNDVQNYISELVKQQAKQEQEVEKYLELAQTTTKDKALFAQATVIDGSGRMAANPGAVSPQYGQPGAPGGVPQWNAPPAPTGQIPAMGQMGAVSSAYVATPYPTQVTTPPPSPLPNQSFAPMVDLVDLNEAIVASANHLRGMSTAEGPGGGNEACAWTVNKVLQAAGIAPLGDNPNYVPAVLDALKQGRGQPVSRQTAKAGDLVVAYGEEHIGIGLDQCCTRVLSNSSSRAAFVWESDTDFDGSYGGSSTIYRLIH
ncbi:MAG: DUF4231 domain-containing protein [Leptolyngbyaceae cyanobacterium bins.302]|nr:DUF4231 domain-containing protein [Leptolyngbyaceae cyanobacterium bins.302]